MRSRLLLALIVAALCLSISSASAAPGDRPVKAAQFGSTEDDFIEAVAVLPDGGFVVVGDTRGELPGHTTSAEVDAFVRAYDAAGCERWTRQFGTGDLAFAGAVAVTTSGNIVVTGNVVGDLPGQMGPGFYDAYVRVYDLAGNEQWTDQFGTTEYESGNGVAVDPAGNIYVTGQTQGSFPSESLSGFNDAYLRKYDPAGNDLWTDQYGTTDGDFPADVTTSSLGVFVSGMTRGDFPGESSAGDEDAFLTKFTPAGSNEGSVQFGTGGEDDAIGVSADDTRVVAVGRVDGTLPGQSPSGGVDAFVRAFNGAVAELWTRQIGTADFDTLESVALEPTGNIVVAGATGGTFPGQTNDGERDALVGTFDAGGASTHFQQFGTSSSEGLNGIASDGDRLRVVGETDGSLPGHMALGGEDVFVATLGGSDFLEIPDRKVKERDRTRKMSFPVSVAGCGTLAEPAELSFSSKGKAKPGKDIKPKLGMITIPAGGTDGKVTLKVKGDDRDERTEKFTLRLQTGSGEVLGTATGKIKDND